MKQKMIESKKVGVVIPIYNVEQYLRDCLESVLNQTYKNIEVLMINDGSSDSSFEIAMEYVRKYPNFKLIDKPNSGQANTRNVGIEYFSKEYKFNLDSIDTNILTYKIVGDNPYDVKYIFINAKNYENANTQDLQIQDIDYIMFLDSDDFWDKECVRECMKHSSGVDIVWFLHDAYCDGIDADNVPEWVYMYEDYHKFGNGKITSDEWVKRSHQVKWQNFFFVGGGG